MKISRRVGFLLIPLFLSVFLLLYAHPPVAETEPKTPTFSEAKEAYLHQRSNLFLTVEGEVAKILRDDIQGTPHQRFMIMTPEGQTILIVHNLQLAPRVPLQPGLKLRIHGEYQWNSRGGLIHKTHHATKRHVPSGWIEIVKTGQRFQ